MKNKVKLGFLSYLLIFIGLVFGVCVILLSVVILAPGVRIFGIGFTNNNIDKAIRYADVNNQEVLIDELYRQGRLTNFVVKGENYSIDNKEYESGIFNIEVKRAPESSELKIMYKNHSHGFSKTEDHATASYTLTYSEQDKTLTLAITDAHMFITTSKSFDVEIHIPNTNYFDITSLSFDFKTISGNINLGDSGNVCNFLTANCETKTGNIKVGSTTKINGDINLKTEKGEISLGKQIYSLPTRKINLESKTGKISTGELIGTLKIISEKSICSVNGTLYGDLIYSSKYGLIKTQNIEGEFKAEETVEVSEVTLGSVSGDITMISGETSNITIAKTNAKVRIKTKKGNIKIGEIAGDTVTTDYHELETTTGSITFTNNSSSRIKVTTEKGKISATYNKIANIQTITSKTSQVNVYIKKGLSATINSNTTGDINYNWKSDETLTGQQTVIVENPNALQVINITSEKGDIRITEVLDN